MEKKLNHNYVECVNCAVSLSEENTLFCGRCKNITYCSKACQIVHWKDGHKALCKDKDKYTKDKVFIDMNNVIHFYCAICRINCSPDHNLKCHPDKIEKCAICLENIKRSDLHTTECYHQYHKKCIERLDKCPKCRIDLSLDVNDIMFQIKKYHKLDKELNKNLILKLHDLAERNNFTAQYWLGFIYKNGYGIEQNYKTAFKYYKAAEEYHLDALFNVGHFYHFGYGVEQDYKIAFNYYSRAAKQDFPDALFCLSIFYNEGLYVKKDYKIGLKFLNKSASYNNRRALYNLGLAYEYAYYDLKQDYKIALEYYTKAAMENHPDAKQKVKEIKQLLNI
jgi:tetratricopeptide (TPR) repeat protein